MFENFAMMIPKHAIYNMNGCLIFGATGEEFTRFQVWVNSGEIIPLRAGEEFIDLWINKDPHGLGRTTKTLGEWFDTWKTLPTFN